MTVRYSEQEYANFCRERGLDPGKNTKPVEEAKNTDQQKAASKLSARRKRSDAAPDLEGALHVTLMQAGLGGFQTNYRFDCPKRWEFDFAWTMQRVAIEVQGGVRSYGKVGHVRPESYERDVKKIRRAQLMDWIIFPCTEADLRDGSIIADVETALEKRR